MIICNEIDEYIRYAEEHKRWINRDRLLLIDNIVRPLLQREDLYFDAQTYADCIRFCEANYYPLFPYQKFIYAFVFIYSGEDKAFPYFRKFIIMMGRGNGKDGFIVPPGEFPADADLWSEELSHRYRGQCGRPGA